MTGREFAGLTAVVTGGSSGIGAAVTSRLHADGADVVVLDRDCESAAIRDGATYIRCDVTDATAVEAAASQVRRDLGRCDALVTCAGVAPVGDATSCTEREWDDAFSVNAKGTWLACRALLPLMVEAGGGALVTIASGAAVRATPGMAAYSASKASVVALTRAISLDYRRFGIRANSLCPGPVDTPLHRRTASARQRRDFAVEPWEAGHPTVATVEEMAEYVVMLLRPDARSFNGATLVADGGRVMH